MSNEFFDTDLSMKRNPYGFSNGIHKFHRFVPGGKRLRPAKPSRVLKLAWKKSGMRNRPYKVFLRALDLSPERTPETQRSAR